MLPAFWCSFSHKNQTNAIHAKGVQRAVYMVVQIHIAVNQLCNCIKCTLKTISGMLFNAYFYKLCNVYNLSV